MTMTGRKCGYFMQLKAWFLGNGLGNREHAILVPLADLFF
jgi:hypothetical protein